MDTRSSQGPLSRGKDSECVWTLAKRHRCLRLQAEVIVVVGELKFITQSSESVCHEFFMKGRGPTGSYKGRDPTRAMPVEILTTPC
jgi:hypothetical protein